MSNEMVARKIIIFLTTFIFVSLFFASSTFLIQLVFNDRISETVKMILSLFISVSLIVALLDFFKKKSMELVDYFLLKKKYNYRRILKEAAAGISQIKSLRQLFNLVVHFVTLRMRVKNAAIFTYDEKDKIFRSVCLRGYPKSGWFKNGHLLNHHDPLVDYLSQKRAPLELEHVKKLAKRSGDETAKRHFQAIQTRMEELQAVSCIPSYFGGQLKTFLVLGELKTGHSLMQEDLNVLFHLAQNSAIAIENARLYDQAIEKAKELEEINDQLNVAQTNLLRALDETEVANKRLKDTHAQLIHEQKMATLGRLASSVGHEVNNPLTILSMNVSRIILKYRRDPDLKVTEVLETLQKMEQNISRIKAVVNTLTGLLKKSERGKFEPLSLKLILEETLPLVQFQTYLENLSGTEVTFDIPANLPLIKGDLERLQEVFLNLFINAYHAMVGKKDRKITVTARESPAHPGMVLVEFSDNGSGMSDDVMKKAFTYGFTTKPAGKGSGMGLYMCRYIIELHGGGIKVRSNMGEGTTFVITIPIHQEVLPSMEGTETTRNKS